MTGYVVTGVTPQLTPTGANITLHTRPYPTEADAAAELQRLREGGLIHAVMSCIYAVNDEEEEAS